MAVANRTITFPSLVAGVQTIPWVASVTLAPVNCRGVNTHPNETWEFVGSLVGWNITTHPRWRLVAARWKQRTREYESGAIRDDYTYQRSFIPPITFPDPNPANWDNWGVNEEKWFSGQVTWINAPSYLAPYYHIDTISDIEFEFQYIPFPPNPLRDPDSNLIIRSELTNNILRGDN